MLRNLVRIGVVVLIVHALYRFAPPYIHYHQFKDAVAEAATFAKDRTDTELLERVMLLADRYQIPIEPEDVQITRDTQYTYINVAYEEQIEWLPSYKRAMPFAVAVEGWHVRPRSGPEALQAP